MQGPPTHGLPQYGAAPPGAFQPQGPPGPPHPHVPVPPAVWVFGLVSVVATVLGLTLTEDGHNAWHTVHAWGALALLGAVLSMTPAVAHSFGATPQRAWQIAAGGVAAFVLFWALLVLPSVGSNTSLLTTVGLGAALIAVWLAPGRDLPGVDDRAGAGPHTW